jgi:hypothetical protein
MVYKRGNVYWYNFRWSIRQSDGTVENFRIVKSARTHKRKDAEDAEDEHRRALRLGEIHPNDPWPKPEPASNAPMFRVFAKEFLQHVKTQRKRGTHTFYSVCLDRILTFAAIADAPLDTITGDLVSRYIRYRQEIPKNSVVTVNGDLRTLRRIFSLAVEWGKLDRAPILWRSLTRRFGCRNGRGWGLRRLFDPDFKKLENLGKIRAGMSNRQAPHAACRTFRPVEKAAILKKIG